MCLQGWLNRCISYQHWESSCRISTFDGDSSFIMTVLSLNISITLLTISPFSEWCIWTFTPLVFSWKFGDNFSIHHYWVLILWFRAKWKWQKITRSVCTSLQVVSDASRCLKQVKMIEFHNISAFKGKENI